MTAATRCLQRYSESINALNVFPVPDGDTGTNMLLTMQSVNERLQALDTNTLSMVAKEAARGALFGARGNSGVIFSQFLAGFAKGLDGVESCGPSSLVKALALGSEASYSAVSEPVEGTMLTVIREFSESAKAFADGDEPDVIDLWTQGLNGAREALEKTPNMLPVLRDAGVVDSGGQGVVVIMEGFLCSFLDKNPDRLHIEISIPAFGGAVGFPTVSKEFLESSQSEEYGFCTEFMIEGAGIDLTNLRNYVSGKGNSVIVVGDSSLAKVHVHTFEPDEVIGYGATMGQTLGIKVDDISKGHEGFVALHSQRQNAPRLAVVAVAWGEGFANLFNDLGSHAVVTCQRTMNPSARELLEAAQGTGAEEVVILPNNSNVILTARQASSLSDKHLHVIPTSTIPQGIAALLAYSSELPPDQVMEAMESFSEDVRTIEVTTAQRDTIMDGTAVKQGQIIALLDGKLVTMGDSVSTVIHQSILEAEPPEDGVVTLYWGGDTQESQALETMERLRESLPDIEVETVYGGQPFYHYVASIE